MTARTASAATTPNAAPATSVVPGAAPEGDPIDSTASAMSTPLRTIAAGPAGACVVAAPKQRHGTWRASRADEHHGERGEQRHRDDAGHRVPERDQRPADRQLGQRQQRRDRGRGAFAHERADLAAELVA